MDNIELFLNGTIGLNCKSSNESDIIELSQFIDDHFKEKINDFSTINSLYKFWKYYKGVYIIFVRRVFKDFHSFDGYYNGKGAEDFKSEHEIFTAAKILEKQRMKPIKEEELINLFK